MYAVLVLLWLIGFAWLVSNGQRLPRGDDNSILARVDEEFQALVVNSNVPALHFDGRTAEIVDERQERFTDEGTGVSTLVRVERFARNAHGEYFFFLSEGVGTPFFKHVSHTNARVVLGKKYVAPAPPTDG